jgi:Uma2 family endonuclease
MVQPMTWKELCEDRRFQDLPFKIELNRQGQIIMSPTRNYHGFFGNKIARLLEQHRQAGVVIVECAIETADGTKEADVAWVSDERWQIIDGHAYCMTAAPNIRAFSDFLPTATKRSPRLRCLDGDR